ncbi:helix-turn-helix domain-containing protein [Ramlibacter henchirensis]|nr:XRE family transcriptional regulator [Ramlibacter henchirensis]
MARDASEQQTPASPTLMGARVRQLRRRRGLTLEELARAVDVDKAHISRIENNHKSPSVAMLAQLAKTLNTSIGHLLGETLDKAEIKVTRAAELQSSPRLQQSREPGEHQFRPLLHGKAVGSFEAFLVHPGPDPGTTEARHSGQEMLYVVAGTVEVMFHDHVVTLKQGDCIHFPGYLHHRLRRVGRAKAAALLVLSNA